MSHREIWNTIVRSRDIWPDDHPMHDLDVIVLGVFLFTCLIAWLAITEWMKNRRIKLKKMYTYEVWEEAWKKSRLTDNFKLNCKR